MFLIIFCAGVFCLHVWKCPVWVTGGHGGQKRVLNPLELELWWLQTSCGYCELNVGPLQEQQGLITTKSSLQPRVIHFKKVYLGAWRPKFSSPGSTLKPPNVAMWACNPSSVGPKQADPTPPAAGQEYSWKEILSQKIWGKAIEENISISTSGLSMCLHMQTHQHTYILTHSSIMGSFEAGDVACLIASKGEKFNLELFDFTSIKQTNKKNQTCG